MMIHSCIPHDLILPFFSWAYHLGLCPPLHFRPTSGTRSYHWEPHIHHLSKPIGSLFTRCSLSLESDLLHTSRAFLRNDKSARGIRDRRSIRRLWSRNYNTLLEFYSDVALCGNGYLKRCACNPWYGYHQRGECDATLGSHDDGHSEFMGHLFDLQWKRQWVV